MPVSTFVLQVYGTGALSVSFLNCFLLGRQQINRKINLLNMTETNKRTNEQKGPLCWMHVLTIEDAHVQLCSVSSFTSKHLRVRWHKLRYNSFRKCCSILILLNYWQVIFACGSITHYFQIRSSNAYLSPCIATLDLRTEARLFKNEHNSAKTTIRIVDCHVRSVDDL